MVKVEHMLVASGGEGATGSMCRAKVFRMAMGQRKHEEQRGMWVAVNELPRSVSHPFYEKLNRLLAEHGFDEFVETQCRPFYAEKMGGPVWPLGNISVSSCLATSKARTRNAASPGARSCWPDALCRLLHQSIDQPVPVVGRFHYDPLKSRFID